MKFSKLFLTACGMAIAMNLGAQSKTRINTTTTETTMYMPDSTIVTTTKTVDKGGYDMGYHLMPEIKIGSCYGYAGFGANLVLEHEFHKYLAWDIVSLDFSAPFDFSEGNIGLKTGLRGFTSRFWGDKVRGFMSLAAGYDCNIREHVDYDKTEDKIHFKNKGVSGLGLSVGIGLQIQKHIFLGYTMEYSTAAKFTSHYGRVGYRF